MSTRSYVYYNNKDPNTSEGSFHIYWEHITNEFRIEIEHKEYNSILLVDVAIPKDLIKGLNLVYEKGNIKSNIKENQQL
jgi:hypothetical protein